MWGMGRNMGRGLLRILCFFIVCRMPVQLQRGQACHDSSVKARKEGRGAKCAIGRSDTKRREAEHSSQALCEFTQTSNGRWSFPQRFKLFVRIEVYEDQRNEKPTTFPHTIRRWPSAVGPLMTRSPYHFTNTSTPSPLGLRSGTIASHSSTVSSVTAPAGRRWTKGTLPGMRPSPRATVGGHSGRITNTSRYPIPTRTSFRWVCWRLRSPPHRL